MLCKGSGKRSADFSAAQRWESIGIFRLSEKFRNFSDSLKGQVPDLSLFSYNIKPFVNAV